MPTQLLIHGIVLTLLTVLILHLVFTAKYHYPLARLNFILLLAAVCMTQISTIIVVIVINHHLLSRSRFWPFMFDYIEVTMPPPDWKTIPLIGWYIMQGAVTFLAHATHIQFLTLLFPSSLEQKLIIAFLGPLCLFSSLLFFTHFLSDPNLQDLGDAIRNTATSTLSLLYTFGLLIWGYVVNRKRAWEHEGGTFGFGVLAIALAFAGTAANFIEVKEDRLKWLPWLVNTVLLWQSWAGFWWWVGAGMWSGEVAEIEKREAKKKKREIKKQSRRNKMINHVFQNPQLNNSTTTNPATGVALSIQTSSSRLGSAMSSRISVVSRRFRNNRRATASLECQSPNGGSQVELRVMGQNHSSSNLSSPTSPCDRPRDHFGGIPSSPPPLEPTEASSSTIETNRDGVFKSIKRFAWVQRWVGVLSEAHNAAAKKQAKTAGEIKETEQVKRWGIGAMTQRATLERVGRRMGDDCDHHQNSQCRSSRSKPRAETGQNTDWTSDDDQVDRIRERHGRRNLAQATPRASSADQLEELRSQPRSSGLYEYPPAAQSSRRPIREQQVTRRGRNRNIGDGNPTDSDSSQPVDYHHSLGQHNNTGCDNSLSGTVGNGRGWTWRGPLMKARLRDVTNYD